MRGDKMMRIGAVIMVFGMICAVIAILPLFFSSLNLGSFWWGLSMLSGLGLALVLIGLRQSSKVRTKLK